MRRSLLTLMASLLVTSAGFAKAPTLKEMEANAKFLAEHPAVAKIVRPNHSFGLATRSIMPPVKKAPVRMSPSRALALPEGWCNVVGSDEWTGRYRAYGVYGFNPVSGFTLAPFSTSGSESKMMGNGGAVRIGDRYHLQYWYKAMGGLAAWHKVYDVNTWELIADVETDDGGLQATDLAYDRINNVCYGAFFTDDLTGWELGTIDFSDDYPRKHQ